MVGDLSIRLSKQNDEGTLVLLLAGIPHQQQ